MIATLTTTLVLMFHIGGHHATRPHEWDTLYCKGTAFSDRVQGGWGSGPEGVCTTAVVIG